MIEWSKTALVFPGQGSQYVGIGKDFAVQYPAARTVFEQADEIFGERFSALCFEGPEDILNDTLNTQPAMVVSGIAALRALQSELPDVQPAYVAGHSVGEYAALIAAGALDFADGLRLVRERARLMQEAGRAKPGAMAALLGGEPAQVREICARASTADAIVVVANDNCPGQIVISGDEAALDTALKLAQDAGIRRAIKLAVSVAAHSPLMQHAADALRPLLAAAKFSTPKILVYSNVSAQPFGSAAVIPAALEQQVTQSVLWADSVRNMITAGAEIFVELGGKDVLTGLLKRIDREKQGIVVNDSSSLHQFIAQ